MVWFSRARAADARVIQLTAAAHHRLLTGGLNVTDEAIETRGIAIAPGGLTDAMAFFLNGRRNG